jgi:hypothetical protein
MAFTDRQEMLWDDLEDIKLRRRNTPLDGHPQEWNSKYFIIKLTTPLGRNFYMWNPGQPVIWTEEIEGAYRYSFTKMGRHARDTDMREASLNAQERGVDGKITFETIDGQQDLLKQIRERKQNEQHTL